MKALRDNVIVDKIEEETVSATGFVLTGTESEGLFQKGKVLSFGVEVEGMAVGDTVVYIRNQGAEIIDDGRKVFVVGGKHVVAVL